MSKNKEEMARREGMSYALRIAKEKGIEELERDLKMRGATDMPIRVSMKACNEAIEKIKYNTCDTILIMSCLVLRDEFGFGNQRLSNFINRFNEKTECLVGDYTTWQETIDILKEECGLDLGIRFFDDKIKMD